MKSKWMVFLFTMAIRFTAGLVLGGLACLLFTWRGILRAFTHNDVHGPLAWLVVGALIGSLVAVFTVPTWQTPWYKGIQSRDENDA